MQVDTTTVVVAALTGFASGALGDSFDIAIEVTVDADDQMAALEQGVALISAALSNAEVALEDGLVMSQARATTQLAALV